MDKPASTTILGSTGLVGSRILTHVLSRHPPVNTISRRPPANPSSSPQLHATISADTDAWPATLAAQAPSCVISALGTTRAQAGSLAAQWKIDHDLNIELARAARKAGTKVYVFVSSAGTRGFPGCLAPFGKMKAGVEDAIEQMGFEVSVVLRLPWILGERERARPIEAWVQGLVRNAPSIVSDRLGVDAEVGARAAVRAAEIATEGGAPRRHWVVEQPEILRLGRDEWVD